MWVLKDRKPVGKFKQDVIDFNLEYMEVRKVLDGFVLAKLKMNASESDNVNIEYGALWTTGAKASTNKPLAPTAYGDFECEGDYVALQERVRSTMVGRKKNQIGNNVLQVLATVTVEAAQTVADSVDMTKEPVDLTDTPTSERVRKVI